MKVTHPSLAASAGAAVVLAVAETVADVPAWLWAAFGVLALVSVVQAARA